MYALRTQNGARVILHTAVKGGETWCLLDTSSGFSPSLLAHLEGTYESVSRPMVMPSRWDAQLPWRPFIPTTSNEPVRPWYYLDPEELQTSYTTGLESQYQSDLRSLEVCASEFCQKYPEYPRGQRPAEFYAISFASLDNIRASQEAMLDRIGFLSWCATWYYSLKFEMRQLPSRAANKIEGLYCASDSRAGVVVDLARDWKTVNFPLWAYHGVPILFKWMPAEQEDPRFSHVSPDRFPSTYTAEQRGAMYDWFFQDRSRHFDVTSGNDVRREGNHIVDFEGWKRRSLTPAAAKEYIALRVIPFTKIKIKSNGKGHSQALFFRWRTNISQVHSEDPDLEDPDLVDRRESSLVDNESEEWAIRELYRARYAPLSDEVYDIDTGLPPLAPTPSLQIQPMVPPSNPSQGTSFSHNTAIYRSQTSRSAAATSASQSQSVHGPEWPSPWPVHANSLWPQPQTPPTDTWTLPGSSRGWSQPNFGRRSDEHQRSLPASAWILPGEDRGWSQPNTWHRADERERERSLPQWPPANTSSGPERSVRARRNTRMESHGRAAPYRKDKASRVSNSPIPSSSSMTVWDMHDSRREIDRRFSVWNGLSSSPAPENSSGVICPVPPVPETTAPQCSNHPIPPPALTALQCTASVGPVGSGVHDAAVCQQPKTRVSFAEYKARKLRQEKPDCQGSAGTTEGVPNSLSLLPSADAKMFVPDGPLKSNTECVPSVPPTSRLSPDMDSIAKPALLPPMSGITSTSSVAKESAGGATKTTMSFPEYKAHEQRQEKLDNSVECRGSVGTMEGVPNSPPLLPSADIEMFVPDGPLKSDTESVPSASRLLPDMDSAAKLALLLPISGITSPSPVAEDFTGAAAKHVHDDAPTLASEVDMAMQDDEDGISLGSVSDVDMGNPGDTSSDSRTGILFFPDHENDSGKCTEARLRAAFANSPTSTISDIFNYAVHHGLAFHVMASRPPSISDEPLSLSAIDPGSIQSWKAAVVLLLQRPHARALVLSGGLEGMIARWIGGDGLVQRVIQGPALTGPFVEFSHVNGQVYYDDTTTEAEREILLGVVRPQGNQTLVRSLWPTPEILSKYVPGYASGTEAWGMRCEHIFSAIQHEVDSGRGQFMTRREWLRYLRHGGFINPNNAGGEVWLQRHDDFVNLSHHDWHCISLSDLGMPYGEFTV